MYWWKWDRHQHQEVKPRYKIVEYFQQNNLNLIVSDKEGGFIVAHHDIYMNNARMTIGKNFKRMEGYN